MAPSPGGGVPVLLDVSASLSPFPLPDPVVRAYLAALDDLTHYPEIDGLSLRKALAYAWGLPSSRLLVGNGSTEFIYLLVRVLKPGCVFAFVPTYSDYEDAARVAGIPFSPLPSSSVCGFHRELSLFTSSARSGDLLFLCNPNNPTGNLIAPDEILSSAGAHPDLFFVIDEAYVPFVGPSASCLPAVEAWPDNLYLLSSPTKFYSIPGLRLGYCAGPEVGMGLLLDRKEPWTVSGPALRVGFSLLECTDHDRQVREELLAAKEVFKAGLRSLPGLTVYGDAGNFLLGQLALSGWTGARLQAAAQRQGVLIRDAGNFRGLDPSFFRVAVRLAEENRRVLEVIERILREES